MYRNKCERKQEHVAVVTQCEVNDWLFCCFYHFHSIFINCIIMLLFFVKFFPYCQFQTLLETWYPRTAESKVKSSGSSMFTLLCYDAQTPPHITCLVTKHLFARVSMAEEFLLHRVFWSVISKNQIKRAFKVEDAVISKEVGMTNEILLSTW